MPGTLVTGCSAAWLARLPWEQEVTSSNLVTPILGRDAAKKEQESRRAGEKERRREGEKERRREGEKEKEPGTPSRLMV
jgi:hypothetical protein